MLFPTLNVIKTNRDIISSFGGYNHNLRIADNEFYDMTNMTSSYYPVLSPRSKRGVYAILSDPNGIIGKDELCYVNGAQFVANGTPVSGLTLSVEESQCPKKLVSMGAYVIILPDNVYVNMADITEYGSIDATVTTNGTVSYSLCRNDGTAYSEATVSATQPESPSNGDLWIDSSSTHHTLKQYSSSSEMWVAIATTYVKISATGIGIPFAVGDGVKISGVTPNILKDLNCTTVIIDRGDDYIVVIGVLDEVATQSEAVTVSRKMPVMDYITESGNRLWGCRYGTNADGVFVNEIYASKLGDFKNWNCFQGISTDSYAASVGTDGAFTGATTHLGYPIFFKEGYLHKIYGNYPANYQIQTTACTGVQRGSGNSLAIVNNILFYKSRNGICAYDGSLPSEMSVFGDDKYSKAVGGSLNSKYYVSMQSDGTGDYHMFVLDTQKGLWHREDNTHVDAFCNCQNELYYIDHSTNKIMAVNCAGVPESAAVEWSCESGVIGDISPDNSYINCINVKMSLDVGTIIRLYIQYDSSGIWEKEVDMRGTTLRGFTIPVRPRRCDHFRIKIEGVGDAKIYSICKVTEQGSDT